MHADMLFKQKLNSDFSKLTVRYRQRFFLVAYKTWYVFQLLTGKDLLGAILLPLSGFSLGTFASVLMRLRCSQVKTIAIEVGEFGCDYS